MTVEGIESFISRVDLFRNEEASSRSIYAFAVEGVIGDIEFHTIYVQLHVRINSVASELNLHFVFMQVLKPVNVFNE